MVDAQTIQELCDHIVRDFQPERIILFGSYASGNPTQDSDADLLVEYERKCQSSCHPVPKAKGLAFRL